MAHCLPVGQTLDQHWTWMNSGQRLASISYAHVLPMAHSRPTQGPAMTLSNVQVQLLSSPCELGLLWAYSRQLGLLWV